MRGIRQEERARILVIVELVVVVFIDELLVDELDVDHHGHDCARFVNVVYVDHAHVDAENHGTDDAENHGSTAPPKPPPSDGWAIQTFQAGAGAAGSGREARCS